MSEARAQLSGLVSQVAFGGEPVMLTRHGKPLVALVPAALIAESETAGDGDPSDGVVMLDLTTRHGETQQHFAVAAHHQAD